MSKLGDRAFMIAKEGSGPSTRKQGRRKVRIERKRTLNEGRSIVEIVGDKHKRISAAGQGDCIIRAGFDRAAAKSRRFRDLLGGVSGPAVYLSPNETHCGQA